MSEDHGSHSTRSDSTTLRRQAAQEADDAPTRQRTTSDVGDPGPPTNVAEWARYTPSGDVLGAGGMGTVRLARDDRFDREVALKSMNAGSSEDASARARFFREARIQGRLEHPAIVPVYDLGTTAAGEPYFTMKRVRGESLAQTLRAQREGKPTKFSRRRLLSALGQVAIAVHYAHERGVVHRDIKPGNIMLGPYGEVYLIDWGVAKLIGEARETLGSDPAPTPTAPTADQTEAGDVVGSLRTMAPEQVLGEDVDARTDVYALGAVLFELLTLEPLHPAGTFAAVSAQIVAGVDARPSARVPSVDTPPELEALCVSATRVAPADRLPSALAFNEAIEAHLDGERDQELRRESSMRHAEEAKRRAAAALPGATEQTAIEGDSAAQKRELSLRAAALREVGRALALDATNRSALGTLVTLLTTPPRIIPQEVALEQRAIWRQQVRLAALGLLAAHVLIIAHMVLLYSFSTGDGHLITRSVLVSMGVLLLCGVTYVQPSAPALFGCCVLAMLSCVYDANIVSSMLPFPAALLLAHAVAFSFAKTSWARFAALVVAACSWAAILFGDRVGILVPTARYVGGDLVLHSPAIAFDPHWFPAFLFIAILAMILVPGILISLLRRTFQRSDDLMRLHAWQLHQLVAEEKS